MKDFWKKILLILFIYFQQGNLHAQKDTLFWFAAPEVANSAGESPIYLRFLTYNLPANIVVSQPANGGFVPINLSIPANQIDSINLTAFLASIESPAANVISNNGLKITSTAPISAFYELKAPNNHVSFSLKGNKGLGDDFYTPYQKSYNIGTSTPASFASFEIVATENNTTVLITPRTAITGHAANSTYSVVLNEGQTYSGRDMVASFVTSLAGSIISSDKKISVTVFEGELSNGACQDAIGDQITTTDYIGKKYVLSKGTNSVNKAYILATQNATSITIHGSSTSSTLINWGETYVIDLTEDVYMVETSKPVYAYQLGGYGCELSSAQVPSYECMGTNSSTFTRTSSDSLGIIVYTRTGFEDEFTLNGNPLLIPQSAFTVVPGSAGAYQYASIYFSTADVPVNSYNIVENLGDIFGLGVRTGGMGQRSDLNFVSEFASYPNISAGPDAVVCANANLSITGTIGGGSVTGTWSTNGYGSFQNGLTNLNNFYVPSHLDTIISPIYIVLNSTGPCPVVRDTFIVDITPAPLVNASANQTVCANDPEVNLNGTVFGGATTGNWTSLGGGSFSPNSTTLNATFTPSPADLLAGNVNLVLTSTGFGACNAVTDTMNIMFTSAPIVDAGVDTLSTCKNNPNVSLNGSVSGSTTTGKWSTMGNGSFSPNNLALNASYLPGNQDLNNNGVWLFLESTNNGNCILVKDSVFVEFTASPTVDAGINQIVCKNDIAVQLAGLVSGPTTTGAWSGGLGSYSINNSDLNAVYTPTATEVSNGTITLTLTSTNNNNCNAVSDFVQINFIDVPFANFNGTDVCEGSNNVFTDFSNANFGTLNAWNWQFGDGNTATTQNTNHQYANSGIYNVQLVVTSSAGCLDTIVKQVEVFEAPNAAFSMTPDCINNNVQVTFADQSTSTDAITNWAYDFGGQGTSSQQNPIQNFVSGTNYNITLIVTTANNCKDTLIQALNVTPHPQAGFYYNTTNGMNVGAVFNFIDTSSYASSYSWTFGDGNSSTQENPQNIYYANGMYLVTLTAYNDMGCFDSTFTYITINTVTTEINTLIPNTITPNDDGKNDVWKLEFLKLLYPNAEVEVYNQWGQRLFYSKGYETPWDASYEGELVPDGNYFFIINLNAGTEQDIYKGALLVLKSRK